MNENAIRFLADENLDRDIVVGLQRQVENLDFVRVQDVGLRTASDPAVLQWAADQARVLVTHDAATIGGLRLRADGRRVTDAGCACRALDAPGIGGDR